MKIVQNYANSREAYQQVQTNYQELITSITFDASMKQINPDYLAWITIPNTKVNYPIVQEVDETYLTTDFYGKPNIYGTLFIRQEQSPFIDQNTIIFGHNMKDGGMFGSLKKYLRKSFYESNPFITITTGGVQFTYQIFSVRLIEEYEESPYYYTFDSSKQFTDYLITTTEDAILKTKIPTKSTPQIITLSTCYNRTKRLIIQAYKMAD